ncbi:MAG: hypothetical protein LLF94_06230, partial [Chlamydiales bacterium]|nr:hypothetical protein [Chlamydiales bacterium]
MNINTTYIDRQQVLENNSSGPLSFRDLLLSDSDIDIVTTQAILTPIEHEISLELLLAVVDERTVLAHLLSKKIESLDQVIWARFKDEPLEALISGPRSFLLEVAKSGSSIIEKFWNAHKLALTSDMLQTDDEETSPVYHFV